MAKPTIKSLSREGVFNVLTTYVPFEDAGIGDIEKKVTKWLKIPEVKAAAEKDAAKHMKYYEKHGDLDNCEIPHDNLFRVLGKYV